jgi:hypothetical protein
MRIPPLARTLFAIAAAPLCVYAQSHLTVAVFNYAGGPRSVVAAAVSTARMAFLGAGIPSRWMVCDAEIRRQDLPAGSYLEFFVIPKLRTPLSGRIADHPAGFAMADAFARPRAYVLFDTAKSVADRTLRPLSVVLGCILIHETGHLLGLGHQRDGVMRANLEAIDMDNATRGRAFNSDEVKELRAALDRSLSLRAAVP